MDLQQWKSAAKARLAKLAGRVKQLTPGTVYGALCASSLLPVVAALGGVLGGVGGNLSPTARGLARPQRGRGGRGTGREGQGRHAVAGCPFDILLEKFEAPQVVQTALSEAVRTAQFSKLEVPGQKSLCIYPCYRRWPSCQDLWKKSRFSS